MCPRMPDNGKGRLQQVTKYRPIHFGLVGRGLQDIATDVNSRCRYLATVYSTSTHRHVPLLAVTSRTADTDILDTWHAVPKPITGEALAHPVQRRIVGGSGSTEAFA
jgi:hypothetical protein